MKSTGHDRDACWEMTLPLVAESLAELVRLGHVDHCRSIPGLRSHQHEVNPFIIVLRIILQTSAQNARLPICGAKVVV